MHENIIQRVARLEAAMETIVIIDERCIADAKDRIQRLELIIESMGYYIPTKK